MSMPLRSFHFPRPNGALLLQRRHPPGGAGTLWVATLLALLVTLPAGALAQSDVAQDLEVFSGPDVDGVALFETLSLEAARTDLALRSLTVPAGAGSLHPHLARVDNTTVLSWLEPDIDTDGVWVLAHAVLGDGGWQRGADIARGADWFVNWADFPSVTPIAGDLWAAHWLVRRPGGRYSYDIRMALSRDGGVHWEHQLTPHADGTPTEHGFVSLFPWDGGAGAVWLDGRHSMDAGTHDGGAAATPHDRGAADAPFPGMTLRAARIGGDGRVDREAVVDDLVCDCCQTDVALGPEGPIVAYRDRTRDEVRNIHVARFAAGRWQDLGSPAEEDWKVQGCPVNGPAIDAVGARVGLAWYDGARNNARVLFAWSHDGGTSFTAPLLIDGAKPLGRVDVVVLPAGGAAVSWMERLEDSRARLSVRLLREPVAADGTTPASGVGAGRADLTLPLALTDGSRGAGFPQLILHGEGEDARLLLAWTDTGSRRVRTMAIDIRDLR